MNILEVLSIRIPYTTCGQFYEVPLNDILLSYQMLEQGCPVQDETECPPLFQTRLFSRDVLSDFAKAWSRLENGARRNNGELVVRDNREEAQRRRSGAVGRTPQKEQRLSRGNGAVGDLRALPDIVPRENANTTVDARDRGLDETLSETFPCSDALSSIPDPLVEGVVRQ